MVVVVGIPHRGILRGLAAAPVLVMVMRSEMVLLRAVMVTVVVVALAVVVILVVMGVVASLRFGLPRPTVEMGRAIARII